MQVEVDQSGKIEQTQINTVIALSNDIKAGVLLNRKIKRRLQNYFRQSKKYRSFPYLVFSACVAILLRELKITSRVVVDLEYTGHEKEIAKYIKLFLKRLKIRHTPIITFLSIGKSSSAHDLASKIGVGKVTPLKKITYSEIISLVFPTKKDRAPKRPRFA